MAGVTRGNVYIDIKIIRTFPNMRCIRGLYAEFVKVIGNGVI